VDSLRGKVVVVTGAARGIGRGTALRLAGLGVRLVTNDVGCDWNGYGRNPDEIAKVLGEITARGGEAEPEDGCRELDPRAPRHGLLEDPLVHRHVVAVART
jgi:NAD(P)-dependent dehydrogenase (short-subunit alcohol dehydrogenase family)